MPPNKDKDGVIAARNVLDELNEAPETNEDAMEMKDILDSPHFRVGTINIQTYSHTETLEAKKNIIFLRLNVYGFWEGEIIRGGWFGRKKRKGDGCLASN